MMGKTKQDFIEYSERLTLEAIEGEKQALEVFIELTELKKHTDECIEKVKKLAYDELEMIGEKDYSKSGYKLNCKSKTTWSFKHIELWNKQKDALKAIEEKAKIAATHKIDLDSETGEMFEPAHKTYSYFIEMKKV